MRAAAIWGLGIAALTVVGILVGLLWPSIFDGRPNRVDSIVSCRNHATFFMIALTDFVAARGFLPETAEMTAEQIALASEYAQHARTSCDLGPTSVPGHGGRQMVKLHRTVWAKILPLWRRTEIPIAWCIHAHKKLDGIPSSRVVVAVPALTLFKWTQSGPTGRQGLGALNAGYSDDEEISRQVAELNQILRSLGEPEVPFER